MRAPASTYLAPAPRAQAAWERFGRLPWNRLVQPAAALADGFEVGPLLAADIAKYAQQLQDFPYTKEVYFPKGKMLQEGADTRLSSRAAGGACGFAGFFCPAGGG